MSKNIKQEVLNELDRRINLLKEHEFDEIMITGNQYEELNQALSKVIGVPLTGELQSMKEFVNKL
jgi:homoserine trans-succinylase